MEQAIYTSSGNEGDVIALTNVIIELIRLLLDYYYTQIYTFILLHEKFLQFDWLRAVVFQLNLKYLHVKITVSHVAV